VSSEWVKEVATEEKEEEEDGDEEEEVEDEVGSGDWESEG
jgi:hypothetical protein